MKHGEVIQSSTVGLFNHQQVVKSKNAPLLLPGVSSPRPAGESSPTILLVGGLPVWAVRPSPQGVCSLMNLCPSSGKQEC